MKNLSLIISIILLSINYISAQTLKITWPIDRAVFQRNGNANNSTATVNIAGQIVCPSSTSDVKYRLVPLEANGSDISSPSWSSALSFTSRSTFFVQISPTAGWYRLEVAQFSGSTIILSASIKFGVGDVYVVAGQSNASGDEGANAGTNPYDCVMAAGYNTYCTENVSAFPSFQQMNTTNPVGPTGQSSWCYGKLANDLIDAKYDSAQPNHGIVPHAFINVGSIRTTVENWINSANGTIQQRIDDNADVCASESFGSDAVYHPYRKLRDVLRYYGSIYGVKTVLWHQGEYDNYYDSNVSPTISNLTSQGDYRSRLKNLIDKSRSDFNSDLNWVIAKVSYMYHKIPSVAYYTRSQITDAQTTTYSSGNGVLDTYVIPGPDSDAIINSGDREPFILRHRDCWY